ncbi:flagellar hook assembly protein FlgD [Planctellipticum variicoloris]|uniref:flagellar hook assembly protein FlgD n=1 Tax=Planctellipticum variicoloris TaxID=3064265 RepID=UPI002C3B6425|nr:flagellar hook capping protein [Planctomycetaceae bacterium SH412]HTN02318.1 flagellar hook capping FlgD N-terminal domain-containing protein [Planctomycetaceae bacterium]
MASAIENAVNAATNPASAVKTVDASKAGLNGLTSQTFLKLLITQLQNQDPTNPTDSNELLQQVSSMQSLQANIELQSTLKTVSLNQQLSSAASFLGKTIAATQNEDFVSGVVDSVRVADGKALLTVDGKEVDLTNVLWMTET